MYDLMLNLSVVISLTFNANDIYQSYIVFNNINSGTIIGGMR